MLGQFFASAITKTLAGILGISVAAGSLAQVVANSDPPAPVIPAAVGALPAQTGATLALVAVEAPVAPPVVAEAAAPAAQASKQSAPTKLAVASKAAPVKAASTAPAAAASTACSSGVTASQIAKFRIQIAKVKAERPDLAAGVAKLEAQVDAMSQGKVCEADLQKMFNSLCADPQVVAVLKAMMSKMSSFARMMVGDPCKKDIKTLLSLLDRMT